MKVLIRFNHPAGYPAGYPDFFSDVCPDDNSKMVIASHMKFSGVHITMPEKILIYFGDDPDIRPDIRPDKLLQYFNDLHETF